MSFILDALRKSENERARGSGPALLESRVVARRRGFPLWAVIVGVILLANLVALAAVLWRRPSPATGTPPVAQAPAVAPAPPPAAPAAPAPGYAPPAGWPPGYAAQPGYPPPAGYAAPPGYPAQPYYAPPPAYAPPPQGYVPPAGYAPPPQTGSPPAYAAAPPADAAGATIVNPADYQPARPAAQPAQPAATPPPAGGGNDALLPSAADLTASGAGLPEQRLALHSYDANPAGRFVLLNSQRLREGETSNDGVHIERITPDGAIASWRGRRFRLTPGQ